MRPPERWMRALAAVALLKVVLGAAALAVAALAPASGVSPRHGLMLAHVAAFAAAGLLLVVGGRADARATTLGVAYLGIASVFADPLVTPLLRAGLDPAGVVRAVMALQVDAFTPFLLWRFVGAFPRAPRDAAAERALRAVLAVSLAAGIVLFAANALLPLVPTGVAGHAALARLARTDNRSLYWPTQFLLCIVALPTLLWRAARAPDDERRRARLLVWGIALGGGPAVARVLLMALVPGTARLMPLHVFGWIHYPLLLSIPFATAYAVLVRRALDVRLVVRRALQYALARYSVITGTAAVSAVVVAWLYRHRDASLAELASTPSGIALASLTALGGATLRWRGDLLARIDRRFFREQYDSRRILGELVARCRHAADRAELADVVRAEIDRALHVERVDVLLLDGRATAFAAPDGACRPLPTASPLVDAIARGGDALSLDFERPSAAVASLAREDVDWAVDGGYRLLVPLRDATRRITGVVALGEKKSELPYSREDHALLAAVASAAEMTLAYRDPVAPRVGDDAARALDAEVAAECSRCGAVQAAGIACEGCGAVTVPGLLPRVIAGKFVVEARVGVGGMGVVYRAVDVQLGRAVAIKTLPIVSPGEAVRLRREARVMASVSHPNLAQIFGAETWHGRPMLLVEYLAGGTLAQRLAAGPLSVRETLALGVVLADVLAAVHSAGVLHRDIKPSNIGFAADGTPKLLDFGLAHLITAMVDAPDRPPWDFVAASGAASDSVIDGTPLYMSPEAVVGAPPAPDFDTWSLCVVLYEAMAGHHPLVGDDPGRRGRRPAPCAVADLHVHVPHASERVAAFFRDALGPDRAARPRTAARLAAALRDLAAQHG